MDLNPRLQFDSFVVGPSNRLAFTAAQAVAQSPGQVYNPLFLYGRSGLGKTHLLQAVGFAAQQQGNLIVRYLTLEEFVGQYHAAVAAGAADALRKSLEETHVLLIDDVQFLAKHREMQSELLRISEAMQGSGRQLLLASDRPPAEIEDLDERLVSRLSGGLLVDLAPPDFETRLAILRRKADDRKVVFGTGVLEAVAEVETASVRELVGLINKLSAFQAVSDAPLTPAGAKALLAEEQGEESHAGPAARSAAGKPAAGGAPPFAAAADEFSAFLSAVTRTVADSLDSWRSRVGEAVMRWQGEGYRTARLEALINKESLPDVEEVLARYQKDVEALKTLAEEAGALDPATAGHARFRDPDKVDEARAYVGKLREGLIPPPAPTPALTFETYVVGAANEPVVRAARLVVQEPGRRYTPLFLVGPSGVGKTHLLHAIGNALAAGKVKLVACLGAQTFVEDLLAAIDADKVEWWRRRYRKADAFLLDDVQLIAGKEQTQDELFNLFNVLADAEKQLVFAADRPPAQLEGVAPRLVTRFEGGLVVELTAPDRPMRAELVKRMLAVHGVAADDEVIEFLSSRPADSARAVQGLVNRALSAIETEGGGLTVAAARAAVGGRAPRASQQQAISSPRPSGLDPALSSREKVVWDWPDIADRLVEELH